MAIEDDGSGRPNEASLDHLMRILRWRRDVRHFDRSPVEEEKVTRLIRMAQMAPSVGFSQPWRFVRVDSETARQGVRRNFTRANEAAALAYREFEQGEYRRLKLSGLDAAPVQLAVFVDIGTERGRGLGSQTMPETLTYSAVMAVHTLWMSAAALGLGVGWVSILDPAAIAKALNVPDGWRLIAYLCIGYPQRHRDAPELEELGWEARDARAYEVYRR